MSNPLRQIVKDIQYKTDLTLDEIADKAGIGRAYFRNEVSKGTSQSILKKLQTTFTTIIEQNVRETMVNEPGGNYQTKNPGYNPGVQSEVPLLQNRLTDKDEIIRLQNLIINMQTKENSSLQQQLDALKETTARIDAKVEGCNLLIKESNRLSTEANELTKEGNKFLKSLEGLAELGRVARDQDPSEHQDLKQDSKEKRKQDGKSKSAAGK